MNQVKYRNMFTQVIIFIFTFGLYGFYWFYETTKELKIISKNENAAPVLWTILLFIPPCNFYSYYKHSELFASLSSEKLNKWLLFVLWLVFIPAIWFIVQKDLNDLSKRFKK